MDTTVHQLAPLGIDAVAESVYRALLQAPGSGTAQLAAQLGLHQARVRTAVTALERLGLASRTPPASCRPRPT